MNNEVKLNEEVFGFLKLEPDSEQAYEQMQHNLKNLFGYVETIQGKFKDTLNAKDVQYLLAFKEHMVSTNMQIESLRRELASRKRRDMSVKAIQLLTKDVDKLRIQCDILNKEREDLLGANKRLKYEMQEYRDENHILKELLLRSQAECKLLQDDVTEMKNNELNVLLPSVSLQPRLITTVDRVKSVDVSRESTVSQSRNEVSTKNKFQPRMLRHILKPRVNEHKRIRTSSGQVMLNMSAGY